MADEKPVQDTLTPEQKTYLDAQLKAAREEAVTTFKTEFEKSRKAPDTYDLKFADGSPLDPKVDAEKIVAHLKAQGFSTEQAQAHLKHLDEVASELVTRQRNSMQTQLVEAVTQWKAETEGDKELGGAKLPATLANVKRAMDRFAPEGSSFRKLVDETGYGNHPEFVRFVNAIGKAMAEDTTILGKPSGGGSSGPKKSNAEVFYDKKSE